VNKNEDKFLTNFKLNDHVPAIDSMHTTVCWSAPWILKPQA